MSADGDTPDEFKIGDPEEISQKKRIHELLSRRKNVIDARDAAVDAVKFGQATEQTAREYYQSRIESLVIDLWTKFENSDMEKGKQYLESEPIDSFQVEPPAELLPADRSDLAAGAEYPDPKEYAIEGLNWFIEHDAVIEVPFTAYTWNPPGERTVSQQVLIPWESLDRGLITAMKFIDETGIDADLEQKEQQTKIDRELLEEVEEWRQKNVSEA